MLKKDISKYAFWDELIKQVYPVMFGIVLFISAAFILHLDNIFLSFIPHQSFEAIDGEYHQRLKFSSKADEVKYLSLGRPFGPCNVFLNDNFIFGNELKKYQTRYPLGIGGKLELGQGDNTIEIKCKKVQGFSGGIRTHTPVVLAEYIGPFLQFFREFTIIYLGPVACFLLMLSIILIKISYSEDNLIDSFEQDRVFRAFILFVSVAA